MLLATTFGITLPSFSEFSSSTSEWSNGMFNELLPFALMIIGITIGCLLLAGVIGWLIHAFQDLTWARKSQYQKEVEGGWRDEYRDSN